MPKRTFTRLSLKAEFDLKWLFSQKRAQSAIASRVRQPVAIISSGTLIQFNNRPAARRSQTGFQHGTGSSSPRIWLSAREWQLGKGTPLPNRVFTLCSQSRGRGGNIPPVKPRLVREQSFYP